jgi:hypothetical protein
MLTLRIGSLLFNYLENLKTSEKSVMGINWVVYSFLQYIFWKKFLLRHIFRKFGPRCAEK